MDGTAQWTQEFGVAKSMGDISSAAPIGACTRPSSMERKIRPQKDQAINCPRCNSTNTKFCYYNNYSLTQPRYFCKTCRRYWTEGGTLRNVPVGGGSRKNKKSINISTSSSSHKPHDPNPSQFSSQNPKINIHGDQGHDLNLGFHGPPEYHHGIIPHFLDFPKNDQSTRDHHVMNSSSSCSSSNSSTPISALNFLRARGLNINNSFIPMVPIDHQNIPIFASGISNFPFQECKPPPSLGFSIDTRYGANSNNVTQDHSGLNGSLMFTLGATKRSSDDDQGDDDQGNIKGSHENSNGFWNGMLGGGTW